MQCKIKQSISEISSTTKNKKENNFGDNINRNNVMTTWFMFENCVKD
jgi:hypothetical protein